jgi:hypothetical protein
VRIFSRIDLHEFRFANHPDRLQILVQLPARLVLELLQASALKECEASEDSRRSFASPLAAILSPMRRFLLIEEIM